MKILRLPGKLVRRRPTLPSAHNTSESSDKLRRQTRNFTAAGDFSSRTRAFQELFRAIWQTTSERRFQAKLLRWTLVLEQDEGLKGGFHASLAAMVSEMNFVPLLAETGLPVRHAVLAESLRRLTQRLLPASRPENDAARLLGSLFRTRGDVTRFLNLPKPLFERLETLFSTGVETGSTKSTSSTIDRAAAEALRLLAARIVGRGTAAGLRTRTGALTVESSPFYRLIFATESLTENVKSAAAFAKWRACAAQCREMLDTVHLHMETSGVSSDLILDLRGIEMSLTRMDRLVTMLHAEGAHGVAARLLANELIERRLEDRRVSSLLRQDLNLLARKTVEHTARSGEHYIAHNRHEYWMMWLAAFGGGLLTVLTAAGKMYVMEGHFPLFVEGLFNSIDYAVSFILLQVFGLALATKQPSATAATFAGIVRRNRGQARWMKISDFTARISRTQLAAAISNVVAVSGGAVAFEWLWRMVFSHSFLPTESARHVYETLHPLNSGTIFFAIGTGILLWLAAPIGGWCENFAAFHNVPAAVAQHPLGERFGHRSMERLANWFEYNLAGWSTSIALGFLLGFVPDIATFFGIPFQVRHVTLTTGTLALAVAHFGVHSVEQQWFYYAATGIAVTFVLNLGVSFLIAAHVALRAYDVGSREQLQLVRFLLRQILRTPWRFLLPIDNGEQEPAATHHEFNSQG